MTGHVSINMFSGLRNPSWQLSDADASQFQRRVGALDVVAASQLRPQQVYAIGAGHALGVVAAATTDALMRPPSGFRGFRVVIGDGVSRTEYQTFDHLVLETATGVLRRAAADSAFEPQLYSTAPGVVLQQLAGMTYAQLITSGSETPIDRLEGPDHQLQCESSPVFHGDTGLWHTHMDDNNCYNYANDKLFTTNFGPAIPGPGNDLGDPSNPLTETSLKRELGADKLEPRGMRLPSTCPPDGSHYVAIVLRHHPVTDAVKDYHCIRLDHGGAWSHKDGPDPVRNTDDALHPITDLTTAKFKWSPTLVGIYAAFFSRRNLID